MAKINVLSREVTIQLVNEGDYICLTDIARYEDAERTDDGDVEQPEFLTRRIRRV